MAIGRRGWPIELGIGIEGTFSRRVNHQIPRQPPCHFWKVEHLLMVAAVDQEQTVPWLSVCVVLG